MKTITSEIELNAPAEKVRDILTNFDAYKDWNPFIPEASGRAKQGARLKLRFAGGMTFRPTVLSSVPARERRWLGRLILPGLFDGEHSFVLEPLKIEATRLVQSETFTGLLVPLFGGLVERSTRQGFAELNQSLKQRTEASISGHEHKSAC